MVCVCGKFRCVSNKHTCFIIPAHKCCSAHFGAKQRGLKDASLFIGRCLGCVNNAGRNPHDLATARIYCHAANDEVYCAFVIPTITKGQEVSVAK